MDRRHSALAAFVSLVASSTACGGSDPAAEAPAAARATAAVPAAAEPPAAAPAPTAAPAPAPAPAPTEAPAAAPTAAVPDPTYVPGHGDRAWGVYLARVDGDEGATAKAAVTQRLSALGVAAGGEGELLCDQGASEALGLPPDAIVSSVYLRTEADARAFATRYGVPVLGVAQVTTMCRD